MERKETIELNEREIEELIAKEFNVTADSVQLVAKPYWVNAIITLRKSNEQSDDSNGLMEDSRLRMSDKAVGWYLKKLPLWDAPSSQSR